MAEPMTMLSRANPNQPQNGSHTSTRVRIVAEMICVLAFVILGASASAQIQNECSVCHGVSGFATKAATGRAAGLYVNMSRFTASAHGKLRCTQCHTNMTSGHIVSTAVPPDVAPYVGKWRAELRPAGAACASCHKKEFSQYQQSIHAAALRQGHTETPYCVDCHGSHYVPRGGDLESLTNPKNVPATCASCHSVGLLMSKFNISAHTYDSFLQSVHGRKLALGLNDVAVCTSCHGVHAIGSPKDPESPLYPTHIVATCRRCHKGASPEFAMSFRHTVPSRTTEPVVYWIQYSYRWVIFLTVAGMIGYVLLDLVRRIIDWIRSGRRCP